MKNKVSLIGRLGTDPVNKIFQDNRQNARFTLATTKKIKDRDDIITWHNIVCWNKRADLAIKYLKKGDLVGIEGEIENRSYEKEGEKRIYSQINVDQMIFLQQKPKQAAEEKPEVVEAEVVDDDLPF